MTKDNTTLDVFLRKTIDFYISIFKLIYKGLKKYWLVPVVLFIIFGLFFYLQYNNTKTYYQAKTSYTFNYINKKMYGDLLFDIEKMCAKEQYLLISEKLNISEESAKKILSLKAVNIVGSPLHEDFTEMKVPFYINLEVIEKNELPVYQKAITSYLENDTYVVKYIDKKQKANKLQLTLIESDLLKINALKSNLNNQEAEKLTELVKLSEEKLNEKIKITEQINTSKSVTLLKSLQPIKVSKQSQVAKIALEYGVLFIFLTLLITTFLYWYKNLKDEL